MASTRGAATPRAPAHGAPGAGVPVAHRREPSALVRRTGCRRDHHSRHPRGAEARLEPEADRRWPANKRRAMPAVSHEAASFAEGGLWNGPKIPLQGSERHGWDSHKTRGALSKLETELRSEPRHQGIQA